MLLGTCQGREGDSHFIRYFPAGHGVIVPSQVTGVGGASSFLCFITGSAVGAKGGGARAEAGCGERRSAGVRALRTARTGVCSHMIPAHLCRERECERSVESELSL